MPTAVHYLPILTTLLSAAFAFSLYRRWAVKRSPHLWWWAFGITTYGLGTLIESTITLAGNTVSLTKAWYIAGALLGGYPLAQGSLFLSSPRKTAVRLTAISLTFVIVASVLVVLSPVNLAALEPHRPSGAILEWRWVRLLTPFVNLYAVFFLIGGAIMSAWRHYKYRGHFCRASGNGMIALGAIMPGIGGSLAKAGIVEALYIGECVGLIVIWLGDRVCSRETARAQSPVRELAPTSYTDGVSLTVWAVLILLIAGTALYVAAELAAAASPRDHPLAYRRRTVPLIDQRVNVMPGAGGGGEQLKV